MSNSATREPEADGPPRRPQTFTSPPRIGSSDDWTRVEKEVDASSDEGSIALRVDLQAASEVALSVCNGVREDSALYARFQAVAAAGEFDPKALSKLQRYAGAAWYVKLMLLQAEACETSSTVPPELIAKGNALAERMLKLGLYNFDDHPDEGPIVSAINLGSGHRKLANNLLTLAGLYARHPAVVAKDPRHYRDTDERDARATADDIVKALSDNETAEAKLWARRCARTWTLLWRSYTEVQSLGRWLLRATPEVAEARFPSLVSEARAPARPQRAAAPANPVTPVDPAAPVVTAVKTRKRRTR